MGLRRADLLERHFLRAIIPIGGEVVRFKDGTQLWKVRRDETKAPILLHGSKIGQDGLVIPSSCEGQNVPTPRAVDGARPPVPAHETRRFRLASRRFRPAFAPATDWLALHLASAASHPQPGPRISGLRFGIDDGGGPSGHGLLLCSSRFYHLDSKLP